MAWLAWLPHVLDRRAREKRGTGEVSRTAVLSSEPDGRGGRTADGGADYAASLSGSSSRASSSRSEAARWPSRSTVGSAPSVTTNASRFSATSAGESIGRINSHTTQRVGVGDRALELGSDDQIGVARLEPAGIPDGLLALGVGPAGAEGDQIAVVTDEQSADDLAGARSAGRRLAG